MPKDNKIFRIFFLIWLAVWFILLFIENKKGDYAKLRYLYSHNNIEKRRYLTGEDLYDFIISCKNILPDKATYDLLGLDENREVVVRYLLWPARREVKGPDFLIVYGNPKFTQNGYRVIKDCKNIGELFVKDGTIK